MNFFRQMNKKTLLLWSLLLSLSLLCAQSVKLHVHNLDHEHNEFQSHSHDTDEVQDHTHLSKAHFVHDTSHGNQHDGVSEIDISPDGLLNKASSSLVVIALFIFFFTLARFVSLPTFVQLFRKNKLIIQEHYVLSPPLRAPPSVLNFF
ncbi:MAG: hypothetical protein GXP14_00395 [Gammaproteobacteria bacterium]|nr:hypothetical protein [Gammaproteobacteria bacterium]